MKKVLLYVDQNQFKNYDYSVSYDMAMYRMGGNSGNVVFQYSLQSMLNDKNVIVTINTDLFRPIMHTQKYYDEINDSYDCVVYSPANIIAEYALGGKLDIAKKVYESLRIPVYAIGLGAQSDNKYSMHFLEPLKSSAYDTFKVLLNRNGRIGVRGYFTAECMKKLGFSDDDFSVIGCPSLFMKGDSLRIDKKNVDRTEFIPLINGFREWNDSLFYQYFEKYTQSIFVCQDEFYRLLYLPQHLTWKEYQYLSDEEQRWYNLYKQNRIQLYGDFPSWYQDIKNRGINFSFGCRIHGNVVPILAGVPAYIDLFDSRVKELAEYFDIPGKEFNGILPDPYELYVDADYAAFNKGFEEKYHKFACFMDNCGLPHNSLKNVEGIVPSISEQNQEIVKLQKERVIVRDTKSKKDFLGKKIAFVAHEFGLFPNHGGIASYLYQMVKYIIENYTNTQVYVLAIVCDGKCNLIENERFHMDTIQPNDFHLMGLEVLEKLKVMQPDFVEVAEFNALCLESLVYKFEYGKELSNTRFFVDNHTATRECYEWSFKLPFDIAEDGYHISSLREKAQMYLADHNMAPSSFLADYVTKKYGLNSVDVLRHPTNVEMIDKKRLHEEISKEIDIDRLNDKFVISYISRFEGRKQQELLIEAFCEANFEEKMNAILVLVGNSSENAITHEDYRETCYKLIPEDMKDKILFFDFADSQMKRVIYAVSDLAIMTSIYENFPVAMTEYVYHGVPIMVSKYNGSSDYMDETRKYTVYDPFKDGDLSNKILQFYRLHFNEKKAIAESQFQNLRYMTEPKRAIYNKLTYFINQQDNLDDINQRNALIVCSGELEKESCFVGEEDIILATSIEIATQIQQIERMYDSALKRHSKQNIYVFSTEKVTNIGDILAKNMPLYIPCVEIHEVERKIRWIDKVSEVLSSRKDDLVIIPTMLIKEISTDQKSSNYQMLKDRLFCIEHSLNMEKLYET